MSGRATGAPTVPNENGRDTTASLLESARSYRVERGWALRVVEGKRPLGEEWQTVGLTVEQLGRDLTAGRAVGRINGAVSGGAVDVDLDAPEALTAGAVLLPRTESVWGRPGAERSHWQYVCDPVVPTRQYLDPTRTGDRKAMLVELRSTGTQSVLPPSPHPTHGRYAWATDGAPTLVDGRVLAQHVARVAAAALLGRHWPGEGGRHTAALALAGVLLRGGWADEDAEEFLRAVAQAAGDEEVEDRTKAVGYTRARLAEEQPATGYTRLVDLVDEKVVKRATGWLELRPAVVEEAPAGAPASGITCTVDDAGLAYAEAGGAISLHLTPIDPLKNRWRATVRRDGAVVDTTVLNLDLTSQRNAFRKAAPVAAEEREVLGRLLLHAALHVHADAAPWFALRTERMLREMAEAEAERERRFAELRRELAEASWEQGRGVLEDPALLYNVGAVAHQLGLAGEDVTVRLVYLVITSRIGAKPISAVVKGESSAGKSYTVETTVKLFPESAVWTFTAMSAKALFFLERSFAHVVILIFEQHGGDDADYLIRTLQSEGRLRYLISEKNPDTGKMEAVTYEKAGPTSFLTTTTSTNLHAENETRIWSVSIDESEEQTAAVMGATARRYEQPPAEPDLAPWRAAQEWLGAAGVAEAAIAYGGWLEARMPRRPVRLRRDFGRLLELVQTSACLHQAQRNKTADGWVVATVADYANAWALVGEAFVTTSQGITRRTLEVMRALQQLHAEKLAAQRTRPGLFDGEAEVGVTYAELMAKLNVGKPAISKHVKAAERLGLVENLETRAQATARLRPHLELLAAVSALPAPEELAAAFPHLAAGVWVHPLTGEKKSLLPSTDGNSGNTPDG